MRQLLAVLAILGTGFAAARCAQEGPANQALHLKKGDDYLAAGKIREAIVEYKTAVAADPKAGPAHLKLAKALAAGNDLKGAVAEFIQAADRMPEDAAVQIQAAEALVSTGRFEDARGRAEKVLEKDPRNIDALIAKGNALAGLRDLAAAISTMEGIVRQNPGLSRVYSSLGWLQMARGNASEAEAAYKRAVFLAPNSIETRLALANFYWSIGRRTEGEAALNETVKLDPKNLTANKALYLMYIGTKRIAQAEAPLKVVAENSPGGDGYITLADYYASNQRMGEAKALYEKWSNDPGVGARAKLRLAAAGLIEGDRAGAYRLIDEVLAKEPRNVEALVGKAQLLLSEGKRPEALASAQAGVAAGPNVAQAHYVLGIVRAADRQIEEATESFSEALRQDFGFAPANYELARLSLNAGKFKDAVQYAKSALQFIPGYGEAHLVLARAEMMLGNPAGAEEPMRLLAFNFPELPTVQAELGRLLILKHDLAGARKAFERALVKNSSQPEAIEGITIVDVRENKSAAARARLQAALSANQNNATLQIVAANLYLSLFKDLPAAERAARQAVTADPNDPDAYGTLARVLFESKNIAGATEEFQKLARLQPKSVGNHTAVGTLLQLQNRPDEAKASYERVLTLDPRAPVAANNLAQLYLDRNENLEVALQLAQTAKAGLPDSHQVDDTLGWAFYKKNLGPQALIPLKRAVAAQPNNAVYQYHLGAAYALVKDKANARLALQKALSLQSTFDGADDARRILNTLN